MLPSSVVWLPYAVERPYSTCVSAGSLVVHVMVAAEFVRPVALMLEIAGTVVSGGAGVLDLSPYTGRERPSIKAPRSGAAPAKPSVTLGMTTPVFFGDAPADSAGAYVPVTSVLKSAPRVTVEVKGLATVILSCS